ncbi:hypothetical protein NXW58_01170 [Bacteroides faecis]|nr:hypothetical protein NXW58_01170 [Bacteroides faecis]
MKKYMFLLLVSLAFTFVACDNDTEPMCTAIEKMAGDWWVTVNAFIDRKKSRRSLWSRTSANEYFTIQPATVKLKCGWTI